MLHMLASGFRFFSQLFVLEQESGYKLHQLPRGQLWNILGPLHVFEHPVSEPSEMRRPVLYTIKNVRYVYYRASPYLRFRFQKVHEVFPNKDVKIDLHLHSHSRPHLAHAARTQTYILVAGQRSLGQKS